MDLTLISGGDSRPLAELGSRPPSGHRLETVVSAVDDDPLFETTSASNANQLTIDFSDIAETLPADLEAASERTDLIIIDGLSRVPPSLLARATPVVSLHRSLLPAFDGPSPVNAAMEASVRVTGATAHRLGPDGRGAILAQVPISVNPEEEIDTVRTRIDRQAATPALRRAIRHLSGEFTQSESESGTVFEQTKITSGDRVMSLRYGENPEQAGALYSSDTAGPAGVVGASQLNPAATDMSYTNYIDAAAGLDAVREFDRPAAVIIKHATPAGVASGDSLSVAYDHALATDPMSAFGGVIALNRACDTQTARSIVDSVKHVVVAPEYDPSAVEILRDRESMRILQVPDLGEGATLTTREIVGGRLIQERNRTPLTDQDLTTVTDTEPTPDQRSTMRFAWQVAKHVRSNAIVFATGIRTVGIGGGQVSRVDAVELAARKADEHAEGVNSAGAVMASDGFFPFPDGIDAAADAGIDAVIQPGGSVNDAAVTERANERGLTMVHTGRRCFSHG